MITGIDGFRTERATCLLAPNPSPMTLDGTNTWLIAEPGSPSVVVIDPGPDDEGHLRRVLAEAVAGDRRVASILLTHGHLDHSAGAARLAALTGAPVPAIVLARAPFVDGVIFPDSHLTIYGTGDLFETQPSGAAYPAGSAPRRGPIPT